MVFIFMTQRGASYDRYDTKRITGRDSDQKSKPRPITEHRKWPLTQTEKKKRKTI